MNILSATREFTVRETFQMRKSASSLKDYEDGYHFILNDICAYEDENAKGETITLYAFFTENDGIIVTQSETAYNEAIDIHETFGSGIEVIHTIGKSKAGREFHTLLLA